MSITYISTPGLSPTGTVYNDGNGPYSSPTITFTSGGTATYDTNDWTLDEDSTRKEQTSAQGVPVRALALPGTPNGNCNVIIPTQSSQLPQPGWKFTAQSSGTVPYFVDKVSLPYKKDDYFVVSVAFHQSLNG